MSINVVDKLVPLIQIGKRRNVATIYIKGFLGKGEKFEDFRAWRETHLRACERHVGWKPYAYGFRWQNEAYMSHFDHILAIAESVGVVGSDTRRALSSSSFSLSSAVPVPVLTAASVAVRAIRGAKAMSPLGLAAAAVGDVGVLAAALALQYSNAKEQSSLHAPLLTVQVRRLRHAMEARAAAAARQKPLRLRLVAHSLGARLALESICNGYDNHLVDDLHLMAGAVSRKQFRAYVERCNGRLPVKNVYVYYSQNDYILDIFKQLESDDAIGSNGVINDVGDNVHAIDVTEHLSGLNKHRSYSLNFDKFVRE